MHARMSPKITKNFMGSTQAGPYVITYYVIGYRDLQVGLKIESLMEEWIKA